MAVPFATEHSHAFICEIRSEQTKFPKATQVWVDQYCTLLVLMIPIRVSKYNNPRINIGR